MEIKIIYQDKDVLVVDKPTGLVVFPEGESLKSGEKTLIDYLIEQKPELADIGSPPRYGIVHRLDKDTSGVLLVAKSTEALIFLQNRFKNREVEKQYVCLVEGNMENDSGIIETLIARAKGDPRKQKAYSAINAPKSAREAVTEYKVLERYKDYTLLEVKIKTGRRHQIRCHLSYLQHPIAGDKLYAFKNSKIPEGLTRQFLHAQKLKIQLPGGETKEFLSELPEELQKILNNIAR
ncbi:MAG: RluA family pseudouridine synthase [Candidatus Staskawiczbacteria bacterium]|nr:RluA family pseudouridine synthase [Candidatus Staskawiczbacteria bacterium]